MTTKDERTEIANLNLRIDEIIGNQTRLNRILNGMNGFEPRLQELEEWMAKNRLPPRVPDTAAHAEYRAKTASRERPHSSRPIRLPSDKWTHDMSFMCHSHRVLPSGATALFRDELSDDGVTELVMVGVIPAGAPMTGQSVAQAMRDWLVPAQPTTGKWSDEQMAAIRREGQIDPQPLNKIGAAASRIAEQESDQSALNRCMSGILHSLGRADRVDHASDEAVVSGHEEPAVGPYPNPSFDRVDEGVRYAMQAIPDEVAGIAMVRMRPSLEPMSAQQMLREEQSVAVVARARAAWARLMFEEERPPRWFWEGYRAHTAAKK